MYCVKVDSQVGPGREEENRIPLTRGDAQNTGGTGAAILVEPLPQLRIQYRIAPGSSQFRQVRQGRISDHSIRIHFYPREDRFSSFKIIAEIRQECGHPRHIASRIGIQMQPEALAGRVPSNLRGLGHGQGQQGSVAPPTTKRREKGQGCIRLFGKRERP
eukprot:scaffold223541_cov25-Tisochrysis_lutea.AAC.1